MIVEWFWLVPSQERGHPMLSGARSTDAGATPARRVRPGLLGGNFTQAWRAGAHNPFDNLARLSSCLIISEKLLRKFENPDKLVQGNLA
jgi:hypothetical protein